MCARVGPLRRLLRSYGDGEVSGRPAEFGLLGEARGKREVAMKIATRNQFLIGGLLVILSLGGQGAASREYQMKAAMLCNFVQFVEWPSDAFPASDSPLIIAVMNPNPFGDVIDQLVVGKTASGRAIVVRHCDSPDDVAG